MPQSPQPRPGYGHPGYGGAPAGVAPLPYDAPVPYDQVAPPSAPGYGHYVTPVAVPAMVVPFHAGYPFGQDPRTGLPYSNKSRVGAGLLQLFLGHLGVGRFYIGSSGVGLAQLLMFLVGLATIWIGIGIVLVGGVALWALIDAIMILTGSVRDGRGLPLRP